MLSAFVGLLLWVDCALAIPTDSATNNFPNLLLMMFSAFVLFSILLIFLIGMGVFTYELMVRRECIRLTSEGFYDHTALLSAGTQMIAWKDVSIIGFAFKNGPVDSANEADQITVGLKNPTAYITSLPTWKRWVAKNNLKHTGRPISITLQGAKDCSYGKLYDAMIDYANAEAKRRSVTYNNG